MTYGELPVVSTAANNTSVSKADSTVSSADTSPCQVTYLGVEGSGGTLEQ